MSEHLTEQQVDELGRGRVLIDELQAVVSHLNTCPECQALAQGSTLIQRAAHSLCDELANPEHPPISDLFSFAESRMFRWRHREIADHVNWCTRCGEDLSDISRPPAASQRRPMLLPAAAAILIVVSVTTLWVMRAKTPQTSPSASHIVETTNRPHKAEWDSLVGEARHRGRMPPPPVIADLRQHTYHARGRRAVEPEDGMRPAGVVVASLLPELTWHASAGEKYVVTVACNDKIIATSGAIAAKSWIPNVPLPRGAECAWQLKRVSDQVVLPQPPDSLPLFRVLDTASLTEIERAQAQGADDFAIALLYARAGVQDEAVLHLRAHIAAHPGDASAVTILHDIQAW